MNKVISNPIDMSGNKKRNQGTKNLKLSTIAKKNPQFKLSAYQTIHKAKLSDRLFQTL